MCCLVRIQDTVGANFLQVDDKCFQKPQVLFHHSMIQMRQHHTQPNFQYLHRHMTLDPHCHPTTDTTSVYTRSKQIKRYTSNNYVPYNTTLHSVEIIKNYNKTYI